VKLSHPIYTCHYYLLKLRLIVSTRKFILFLDMECFAVRCLCVAIAFQASHSEPVLTRTSRLIEGVVVLSDLLEGIGVYLFDNITQL